jgi:hypothetical protein
MTYTSPNEMKARVFEQILNENSIEYFFKLIISTEIVQEIVDNTNRRIHLIDISNIEKEKYKYQRSRSVRDEITCIEIYAFIGLLLLFGITKKSHVSIEEIWNSNSIHYASFAAATLSRERYQLISKNLTFYFLANYFFYHFS